MHLRKGKVDCRRRVEAGEFPSATLEAQKEADLVEQAWRVRCRKTGQSILSGPPRVIPHVAAEAGFAFLAGDVEVSGA